MSRFIPAIRTVLAACALCIAFGAAAQPGTPDDLVRDIQERWAEIKYSQPEKQRAALFHELAEQAHRISAAHPNHVPALVWEGIVVSSEAGARGGRGTCSKRA